MKVTYISKAHPSDVHAWSGIIHSAYHALKDAGNDLTDISPLSFDSMHPVVRLKKKWYQRYVHKRYLPEREPIIAREMAKMIALRIPRGTDLLFSPSSIPLSMLETKHPKVIYTDATFASIFGFYEAFTNLCKESVSNGHDLERKAIQSSALSIYSSQWAADSAIRDYGAQPSRVHVVPFGASLTHTPGLQEARKIVAKRSKDELHLLFLAVDWRRKGGDTALEAASILNGLNIKTYLHVVGIRSVPLEEKPDYLINYGYISKKSEEGIDRLRKVMEKCHFMFVPSRADCTPVVFGEGNAYAMPVITTDVGGIPSMIREGVNGSMLAPEGGAKRFARRILEYWADKRRYEELCLSSYHEYETRLNWKTTGAAIQRLLETIG
jgi:glycosyltransferase involved in cell wall biosynthesis